MHKDSKLPKTRTRKRKIYYRFNTRGLRRAIDFGIQRSVNLFERPGKQFRKGSILIRNYTGCYEISTPAKVIVVRTTQETLLFRTKKLQALCRNNRKQTQKRSQNTYTNQE